MLPQYLNNYKYRNGKNGNYVVAVKKMYVFVVVFLSPIQDKKKFFHIVFTMLHSRYHTLSE